MFTLKPYPALLGLVLLLLFARPTHAFGAGNIASISKIEGQNWRHGDLEDTLLTIVLAKVAGGKKFDKLNVARVYFGNWLRDYSQAVDVGTVKSVSAEAIRLLLSVLGFLTFGYGSGEFEVTSDRLGCYRPEDHIDNPKDYAENEDARQYDKRLRAPIDEKVELGIDNSTGMKNYISNERINIMSSGKHVRSLFTKCIELGRKYGREKNKADYCEALRLLGTALHCLEDFLAHSNYTELALIELGEENIFAHVGGNTKRKLGGASGPVYPLVTGTFGGVDFLHSVTGEVSDKLTQNEIEELEGTLEHAEKNGDSIIETILNLIPDGIFGDKGDKGTKMHEIQDNANNSQLANTQISPREPEEYTRYVQEIFKTIMPAIEFHDELLKGISEAIQNVPILPKILEQLEEQLSMWVFAIIAPFIVPVLQQVKNELRTGSSEIIKSSEAQQHVVFEDDNSTDPTHSMLSKDHFTNILNEVAGKTAQKIVAWIVPQIMEAWDDDGKDINKLCDKIIHGVLHHPAQRNEGTDEKEGRAIMFKSVEEWWNGLSDDAKEEHREKLSREGVEQGRNHRENEHDTGHGCGKPLGLHKSFGQGGTLEDRIAAAAAGAIMETATGAVSDFVSQQTGGQVNLPDYKPQESRPSQQEISSAGDESGGGGFLGSVAGSLLGAFGGGGSDEQKPQESNRRNEDEGSRTDNQGYRRSDRTEERTSYGGGYEERTESRYESSGRNEDSYSRRNDQEESYGQESYSRRRDDEPQESSYSSRRNDGESESYGRSGYNRDESYSSGGGGGYGREESSYSRREEESSYSRRDEYGSREESSYSRREEYGSGGDGGYGEREQSSYSRRDEDESSGYGRRNDESEGYGRRRNDEGYGY
ncbi:hypothetical protein ABW19_dt0209592 [Dactylella cylindrospora]|nr:hypothetical protein ABW19_dt0209592 [Dactylella cylindrospora]